MKRSFLLILMAALILSGCGLLPTGRQDLSDSGMATRVSQLLTAMPTSTGQPGEAVVTLPPFAQPTAQVIVITQPVVTATPMVATQVATAASLAVTQTPAPSATPQMTETATLAPTATTGPTATISPNDPRQRLGNPAYIDTMDKSNTWPGGTDPFTSIDFKDGWLYLTALDKFDGWRLTFPELQDFYLEATIRSQQCSGLDHWGIIARVPDKMNANQGYLFGVNCEGQFSLRKFDGNVGKNGTMTTLINWKSSPAIKIGANQTNRLGLMAIGSRLILYINGIQVGESKDSTYTQGYYGVFIGQKNTPDMTIGVDEMDYWENPTP
jgi:hypothetical protein